jgi:hypothetical protein
MSLRGALGALRRAAGRAHFGSKAAGDAFAAAPAPLPPPLAPWALVGAAWGAHAAASALHARCASHAPQRQPCCTRRCATAP